MNKGHFYYINDQYFIDFSDNYLMKNKEVINGQVHDRPCFFAFKDSQTGLFWMIPISSQIEKFEKIYSNKIKKYGKCDTIVFGEVLGYKKAFLIQNMCPITNHYIKNEYWDKKSNCPVRIAEPLEKELIRKAKLVLSLQKDGAKLIFPNVLEIEKELLKQ